MHVHTMHLSPMEHQNHTLHEGAWLLGRESKREKTEGERKGEEWENEPEKDTQTELNPVYLSHEPRIAMLLCCEISAGALLAFSVLKTDYWKTLWTNVLHSASVTSLFITKCLYIYLVMQSEMACTVLHSAAIALLHYCSSLNECEFVCTFSNGKSTLNCTSFTWNVEAVCWGM